MWDLIVFIPDRFLSIHLTYLIGNILVQTERNVNPIEKRSKSNSAVSSTIESVEPKVLSFHLKKY